VVEELVDRGAAIDVINLDGVTALEVCVWRERERERKR
jgi:hypothetical protein